MKFETKAGIYRPAGLSKSTLFYRQTLRHGFASQDNACGTPCRAAFEGKNS